MNRSLVAALVCASIWIVPARAQRTMVVLIGADVPLVTVDPLSSKTSAKGDMVRLKTEADVKVDGVVVIPAGTESVGQVIDARAKGAMGMSGRLAIRPLYLSIGSITVRLSGAAVDKGSVTAGAVIGTVALGTPVFTGRSATIPAGAPVAGKVERTVILLRP